MEKTTCYYCYYNTRCAKLPYYDADGTCTDWRPYIVPRRLLNQKLSELYAEVCESAAHIYDGVQRAYIQRVFWQAVTTLDAQIETAARNSILVCSDDFENKEKYSQNFRRKGKPW